MDKLSLPPLAPDGWEGHYLNKARCSCCKEGVLEAESWNRCGNMTFEGEYRGPRHPRPDGAQPWEYEEPIHHAECSCQDCVPGTEFLNMLATGLWTAGMCAKAKGT